MKSGVERPDQSVSEEGRLARESMAAFKDAVDATEPEEQAAHLERAQDAAGDSALADAYVFLQKLAGGIAVLLPPVVAIGNLALGGDELKGSISSHYYTRTGNVFVGALCALGVFFLSYQHNPLPGHEIDNKLSHGASAAAIGVALFPTAEHKADPWTGQWYVSTLHLVCACTLFVLLAFFSLRLFTKTGGTPMTDQKRRRNVVFRACGWTIVGAILLVVASNVVDNFVGSDTLDSVKPLFWLESIAVVAFGISWLVKSGFLGILADRAPATSVTIAPDLAGTTGG
jgi:hypothetical protein